MTLFQFKCLWSFTIFVGMFVGYLIGKRRSNRALREFYRRGEAGVGVLLLEVIIVVTILLILLGMAVPSALRVRAISQQKTAQNSVFLANQSLYDYATLWGGFPASINNLTSGGPGNTTCNGQFLATPVTVPASGIVQGGYQFTYTPGGGTVAAKSPCSLTLYKAFSYTAVPTNLSASNPRSFYADQSGVIRMSDDVNTVANSSSSTVFQTETTPGLVLLQGPQGAPGPAAGNSSAPQQSCAQIGGSFVVNTSGYQTSGGGVTAPATIPMTVGPSGKIVVGLSGGFYSSNGPFFINYTLNGSATDSIDANALRLTGGAGSGADAITGFYQDIATAAPGSNVNVGLSFNSFGNNVKPQNLCLSAQTF